MSPNGAVSYFSNIHVPILYNSPVCLYVSIYIYVRVYIRRPPSQVVRVGPISLVTVGYATFVCCDAISLVTVGYAMFIVLEPFRW